MQFIILPMHVIFLKTWHTNVNFNAFQVPIYCLSAPINMVKEASGRDSPADCSEPVEAGSEMALRLRLSTTCKDLSLSVGSKHTIAHCKAKLHV